MEKRKSSNKHGVRIGFIVGHTTLRPGAKNLVEFAENKYHREILDRYFCSDDGENYVYDTYFHASYNLGYTAMCKATAKIINTAMAKDGDYDIIFALHFNAAESENAHGAEVLHYFKNDESAKIGRVYLQKLKKEFGSRNRGLRPLYKKSQRGYSELFYPKASVCTLEPFFSSNAEDALVFTVDAYGKWLREFVDNLYL